MATVGRNEWLSAWRWILKATQSIVPWIILPLESSWVWWTLTTNIVTIAQAANAGQLSFRLLATTLHKEKGKQSAILAKSWKETWRKQVDWNLFCDWSVFWVQLRITFLKVSANHNRGFPSVFNFRLFSINLHSWSCLELELDIGVDEIVLKLKISFISINIDFHANRGISIDSMSSSKLVCVVRNGGCFTFSLWRVVARSGKDNWPALAACAL